MSDPPQTETLVDRLTLDIPLEDLDYLGRVAKYRNALAKERARIAAEEKKASGEKAAVGKPRLSWSRKSLAESLLKIQTDLMRVQFEKTIAQLGPIPHADDKPGMARYVKRVVALEAQKSSK